MQLLKILFYPNESLRATCKAVPPEHVAELAEFNRELMKAMYAFDGVGLAAPQVGVQRRIVAIDLRPGTAAGERMPQLPLILINPEIIEASAERASDIEGCLSFPGVRVPVVRSKEVRVRFMGEDGVEVPSLALSGLPARAIQHEIDHLDGRLLIDHIKSPVRRDMVKRKLARAMRTGGPRPHAPGVPK